MVFITEIRQQVQFVKSLKRKFNHAFSLFVHMERVSDQQTQKQLYDEMIEFCQIADRGGMHAVWTGEHHAMNFTIAPNPFLNLVDLANKTKMFV